MGSNSNGSASGVGVGNESNLSLRSPSPAAVPPHHHHHQNQNQQHRDSLAPSVRSSFAGSEASSSAGYGEYRLEDYDAVERLRTPSIQVVMGNVEEEKKIASHYFKLIGFIVKSQRCSFLVARITWKFSLCPGTSLVPG
jgi:hypothetical protein